MTNPQGSTADFTPVVLGACPICNAPVIEREQSYSCSAQSPRCRFAIWKTIAGKSISVRAARTLLQQGRTAVLKGFKSKAGKRFEARLKLESGEIRFEFEHGKRFPPAPDTPESV
jgi:DNA topoisomerase-3